MWVVTKGRIDPIEDLWGEAKIVCSVAMARKAHAENEFTTPHERAINNVGVRSTMTGFARRYILKSKFLVVST